MQLMNKSLQIIPSNFNFSKILLSWHKKDNKRTMPWKGEKDPYKIWLSEIILQQTRVEQGLNYYNKFIEKFPTIKHLAKAKDDEVFKLWEGLGYYSRCKNLLFSAREVVDKYEGIFPILYDDIIKLKGVGKYTTAAIASFAYNKPYAVLDGNVFRVLARIYGINKAIDTREGKLFFENLSQDLLDVKKPALYNQAIMDFGATICKPKLPECDICPIIKVCKAYKQNKISSYPIKEKKIQVQTRWMNYVIIRFNNQVLIRKRTEKDIWQNLHEFYLMENNQVEKNIDKIFFEKELKKIFKKNKLIISSISKQQQQKLTHRTIKGYFVEIKLEQKIEVENYFWIDENELNKYSFPKFINEFIYNSSLSLKTILFS